MSKYLKLCVYPSTLVVILVLRLVKVLEFFEGNVSVGGDCGLGTVSE